LVASHGVHVELILAFLDFGIRIGFSPFFTFFVTGTGTEEKLGTSGQYGTGWHDSRSFVLVIFISLICGD